MSHRYPGGVLSSTAPTTSNATAKGIWTEQSLLQNVATGNWPRTAGTPTIGTATAGSQSAVVTFTAPSDVGTGTLTYTVTSSPGSITATGSASPITVTGLTDGTAYTFTVKASTPGGTSPSSAASNSVTPSTPVYIEDVFSTYLYSGVGIGTAQTITNGIDLSTNGGLVWIKERVTAGYNNILSDTVRGGNKYVRSNTTGAQSTDGSLITAFNTTGFSLQVDASWNGSSSQNYVSWTFREQAKFFDVVTYTGDGTNDRNVPHNLGSAPGCYIVKATSTTSDWYVYHRGLASPSYFIRLNTTAAQTSASSPFDSAPTSTTFNVWNGTNSANASGVTYVAYLFAHNAGGFGLTGTDNVITCGSFTATGTAQNINLGYEAQWLMVKPTSAGSDWWMFDIMRGMNVTDAQFLRANTSGAGNTGTDYFAPTSTGFRVGPNPAAATYIYIAIRRGPMAVPTVGTTVFNTNTATSNLPAYPSSFPVDLQFQRATGGSASTYLSSRLTGATGLFTNATDAEYAWSYAVFDYQNGWYSYTGFGSGNRSWMFRRAPSFMDEVCYTGNDTNRTINHNLTVAPEMMIVKSRVYDVNWGIYHSGIGPTKSLYFNSGAQQSYGAYFWNDTAPTSSVFSIGQDITVNGNNTGYVAYLFATCAGVSKVGSYTGTGALQTVACGFTTGARFVLIKRADSTGGWYYWDSSRGISSGNDPYLLLNDLAAEVTGTNYVDTTSVGFQVTAAAPAALNASGGTYIFLAIA